MRGASRRFVLKYLIAADSFKGCLDAVAVCDAVARGVTAVRGNTAVCLPLADGGEGTCAAICRALGGNVIECPVTAPDGNTCVGYYGTVGDMAVIDTASASGLQLARAGSAALQDRSTYGTGVQIADMLSLGYRRIIVGLGGSGTNDGGIGAAAALGVRFYDYAGQLIGCPCARDLSRIGRIDVSEIDSRLSKCELTLMYDVAIPLTGERGASLRYSKQKGADPRMMNELERGMQNYALVAKRCLGVDPDSLVGAGAAGGLGFGLAIVGGKLVPGAERILNITGFDEKCSDCDVVITGEGRTDRQTADGKLPSAVALAAKRHSKPVACICGSADPVDALYKMGIDGIFAVQTAPMSLAESIANAESLIENTAKNIAHFAEAIYHSKYASKISQNP